MKDEENILFVIGKYNFILIEYICFLLWGIITYLFFNVYLENKSLVLSFMMVPIVLGSIKLCINIRRLK